MKRIVLQLVIFAALLVLAFPIGSGQAAGQGSAITLAPAAGSVESGGVFINEVMFAPVAGGYEWIELKNGGGAPVRLAGWGLTDEDGNWYRFPAALPSVPIGAFVVVVFDGQGGAVDDLDFGDNVATLHSPAGLTNVFEDSADQVALYRATISVYLPLVLRDSAGSAQVIPSSTAGSAALVAATPGIVAFVAWGADPTPHDANAAMAGIWAEGTYKSVDTGLGETSGLPAPNETIGLVPGGQGYTVDDWTLYPASQTTQGSENAFPVISWYYPAAGATLDSATFAVSWNPLERATGYRFQMANDSDFSSPTIDLVLPEASYIPASSVTAGAYYWRVKGIFEGGESNWSAGVQVHSLDLPYASGAVLSPSDSKKTLGIAWQLQHKDTNMLCLDGDPEMGNFAWDRPHAGRGVHGGNYCVRASVSMLASYYGGKLSQDRVSYEIFGGGAPEGDLGHNIPVTYQQAVDVLSWALGVSVPAQLGKPTFDQLKAWIDADRPLHAPIKNHSRIIDGYWEFTSGSGPQQWVHVVDPWDLAKWVRYADEQLVFVQVAPAGAGGAPNVRSDEDVDADGVPDTMQDSDGDGIVDFDERNRFRPFWLDPDSDRDGVPDKADMREYIFDNAGAYSRRNPDADGDGKRKEVDPDNDDGGSPDGCEDANHNGKLDPGESSNFDSTKEIQCGDVLPPSDSSHYEFLIYTVPWHVSGATITATATWASDWYLPSVHTSSFPNLVEIPYVGGYGCDFIRNYPQNNFVEFESGMDTTDRNAVQVGSIDVGPGKSVAIAGSDCYFGDNFTFHRLVKWTVKLH